MTINRFLVGGITFCAACMVSVTMSGETKSNAGSAYLLSQTKDMSRDFSDLSNTYFFADSLVSFNTADGTGIVEWKRQQLMPRQAFNANTYLHQPLKSLDFPDTAYPQNPRLSFTVVPVNARTLRIRVYTSPVTPKENDYESVMLAGQPVYDSSEWKISREGDDIYYTSPYGSLEITGYPWRLVLRDASGKELTRTRVWSDNDSTQVKVAPFSFI